MIPVKTNLISKNPVYIFDVQVHSTARIATHYSVEIHYAKLETGQHKLRILNNPPHNNRSYVFKTEEEAICKYEELLCSLYKQNFVLAEDFNKEEKQ